MTGLLCEKSKRNFSLSTMEPFWLPTSLPKISRKAVDDVCHRVVGHDVRASSRSTYAAHESPTETETISSDNTCKMYPAAAFASATDNSLPFTDKDPVSET